MKASSFSLQRLSYSLSNISGFSQRKYFLRLMVCFNLFHQVLMMFKPFFNSFIFVFENAVCSTCIVSVLLSPSSFRRYCQFFFTFGSRVSLFLNVLRHSVGVDPGKKTGAMFQCSCIFLNRKCSERSIFFLRDILEVRFRFFCCHSCVLMTF